MNTRLVHDAVRAGEVADHAERVRAVLAQLHERRLADEVAAEQHPVADFLLVEVAGEVRRG